MKLIVSYKSKVKDQDFLADVGYYIIVGKCVVKNTIKLKLSER